MSTPRKYATADERNAARGERTVAYWAHRRSVAGKEELRDVRREASKRRARLRERERRKLECHTTKGILHVASKPSREALEALLAAIPPETRTPAQILMGDPPFQRSALYRRQA